MCSHDLPHYRWQPWLLIGALFSCYLTRHCIISKQKKIWIILEVREDTLGRNLGSLQKLLEF